MTRTATENTSISKTLPAKRWAHILLATASITALLSAPSFAQTLATFSLVGIAGSQSIGVSSDGGANYYNRGVGRYQGAINGANFNVFCVDILHGAALNTPFTANVGNNITDAAGPLVGSYYNGGLASALTLQDYQTNPTATGAAQRSSQVAWLADSFLNADANTFSSGISGSTSVTDNLAAISLSIWDINQDGGDGITAGNLRIDSASQVRLGGLVAYYQEQARRNSSYVSTDAKWVQAPRNAEGSHMQDFVYTTKPIPEAGTLALLGLIAAPAIPFVVRRMRRAA